MLIITIEKSLEDIIPDELTFSRNLIDTDISIGNEYWTVYGNKNWKKMMIRNIDDIKIIVNFPDYKRKVELISNKSFERYNLSLSNAVTLPDWYNVTDDCLIYQGAMNNDELEVPILVYHQESKLLSMFMLNKIGLVMQIYLIFMGIKCETINDLNYVMRMFYEKNN
jgi:hypothetical protein